MIALLAAFQFLTILPPVIRRAFSAGELGRAVGFFPLVGLALGGILFGLDAGLRLILPPGPAAVLLMTAWLLSTRALHFDGFLDTCDGLFGGFTSERRLEIMRDSRVGAFGVAGGGMLLLAIFAGLTALTDRFAGLMLAPVLGRWAMSLAVVLFPYARDKGLGRDMKDNARLPQAALATGVALAAAWLGGGWAGLIALGIAAVLMLSAAGYTLRRIPGLTGDIYGAVCVIVEVAVLLFLSADLAWLG